MATKIQMKKTYSKKYSRFSNNYSKPDSSNVSPDPSTKK